MRAPVLVVVALIISAARVSAQSANWMLMTDGALFATFNHQGTDRGGTEFKSTNWWMGMASRRVGGGQLTLTGMLSLDALTATSAGYREVFQAGEVHDGRPIVDRQHPHDFLMQASAAWRFAVTDRIGLTIAGAPVGEPALGPIAFMHRPSAAENPAAPLAHHTLDSTHIAMGVVTAAVDGGRWTIESSLFRGREPDDNRWDLMDPGALDSWSARVWFAPTREWQLQVSHGFLKQPEEFEPDDVRRTTASASWMRTRASGWTAVTAAYGRNDREHDAFNAVLVEATHRRAAMSYYGRFESVNVETELLLQGPDSASPPPSGSIAGSVSRVEAFTFGAVREVTRWRGFEIGTGGDLTVYGIPGELEGTYGSHGLSLHVFLRLRPPVGHMGRMWNMTMARPMMH